MSSSDGDMLGDLLAEHASLERELGDPAVHTDRSRARRLGRRYAQLAPLVETARALDEARGNLATARELAGEDASFAAEAATLETQVEELSGRPQVPPGLLQRPRRLDQRSERGVPAAQPPGTGLVGVHRRVGELPLQGGVLVEQDGQPVGRAQRGSPLWVGT